MWTDKAPTEPGWYWYRDATSDVKVVQAQLDAGKLMFYLPGIVNTYTVGEMIDDAGGAFWTLKLKEPKL